MFTRNATYLSGNSVLCKSLRNLARNIEGGGLIGHTLLDGTIGESNLDRILGKFYKNSMLAIVSMRSTMMRD